MPGEGELDTRDKEAEDEGEEEVATFPFLISCNVDEIEGGEVDDADRKDGRAGGKIGAETEEEERRCSCRSSAS